MATMLLLEHPEEARFRMVADSTFGAAAGTGRQSFGRSLYLVELVIGRLRDAQSLLVEGHRF